MPQHQMSSVSQLVPFWVLLGKEGGPNQAEHASAQGSQFVDLPWFMTAEQTERNGREIVKCNAMFVALILVSLCLCAIEGHSVVYS